MAKIKGLCNVAGIRNEIATARKMGKGKRDYTGRKAILLRFIKRCAFTRKLQRNQTNIGKQEFEWVYKIGCLEN